MSKFKTGGEQRAIGVCGLRRFQLGAKLVSGEVGKTAIHRRNKIETEVNSREWMENYFTGLAQAQAQV